MAVLVVPLMGCAQRKKSPPTSGADAAGQAAAESASAVAVLESDAGKTIELNRGQRLVIRLQSNRSTGYSWMMIRSVTNTLSSLGDPVYRREATPTDAVGAGGIESWSFKATTSGQDELHFEYRKPSEHGSPAAKTVSYLIKVR